MADAPTYPPVKIPPKKEGGSQSQRATFTAYINAHPNMRQYAEPIYKAAHDYGVDATYYASLLWKESFAEAQRRGVDPETIVSPTGQGVGIAQINPNAHVGDPIPWAPGQRVTRSLLDNPAFSIRWGAYYFSQGVARYGSYEQAYKQFYNPGYAGDVFQDVPKGYVPTTTAKSPAETAARGAETTTAKAALGSNAWAVFTKGKFKFVTTNNDGQGQPVVPAGVLRDFGQPVDKSSFLQMYAGISDDYLAYLGRRPKMDEAAQIIKAGKSQYSYRTDLASKPGFVNSPVWRQNAAGYEAVWQNVFGPSSSPDTEVIRYAIANNIGADGLTDLLRNDKFHTMGKKYANVPSYEASQEFQQQSSSLANVFESIYGASQPGDGETIKAAVKNGYDQNQFARYLRAQPQWKSSPEAQSLWYGLAQRMGLIPGASQTVLQPSSSTPQVPAMPMGLETRPAIAPPPVPTSQP